MPHYTCCRCFHRLFSFQPLSQVHSLYSLVHRLIQRALSVLSTGGRNGSFLDLSNPDLRTGRFLFVCSAPPRQQVFGQIHRTFSNWNLLVCLLRFRCGRNINGNLHRFCRHWRLNNNRLCYLFRFMKIRDIQLGKYGSDAKTGYHIYYYCLRFFLNTRKMIRNFTAYFFSVRSSWAFLRASWIMLINWYLHK